MLITRDCEMRANNYYRVATLSHSPTFAELAKVHAGLPSHMRAMDCRI